jgi:antitoxin CptB
MINSLKKAKLKWHCRRGMLELDLILIPFVENYLDKMSEVQIAAFADLLNCTDQELYRWLMGHEQPQDKELRNIVEFIRLQDNAR